MNELEAEQYNDLILPPGAIVRAAKKLGVSAKVKEEDILKIIYQGRDMADLAEQTFSDYSPSRRDE